VSRLRDEAGFTLTELLVGASLMIVIMSATLSGLTSFQTTTRSNGLRNDAQQNARTVMDTLARDLRNGAASSADSPLGIERADDYELVFQTVADTKPGGSMNGANLRRDRYCLDSSNPADGRLIVQSQTWNTIGAPPAPAGAGCPSPAWGSSRVVAQNIVNRRDGQSRALFVPNSPTAAQTTRLGLQLYISAAASSGDGPREALLRSAVALRNSNQPPTAAFTASVRANGHVMLNASASTDPEGEQLSYVWYDGSTRLPGTALTYDYDPSTPGDHDIRLAVYDPAGLRGVSEIQTVNVP
jgi:type II secretory pathway pseudopilin PulG